MEKKFTISGFKEKADLPFLYDDETYSFEEAKEKAREYFKQIGLLCKVIIFEQNNGEQKAARFIYRNKFGQPEEIENWWESR